MCYMQAQPIPVASFLYVHRLKEGRTKRMTQEENERQNMEIFLGMSLNPLRESKFTTLIPIC